MSTVFSSTASKPPRSATACDQGPVYVVVTGPVFWDSAETTDAILQLARLFGVAADVAAEALYSVQSALSDLSDVWGSFAEAFKEFVKIKKDPWYFYKRAIFERRQNEVYLHLYRSVYNIYPAAFRRRSLPSKSGFIGRVGKRKKGQA